MDNQTLSIVAELAKAAHSLEAQADESTRLQAGHVFESALRRLHDMEGRELPELAFPTRPPFWWLCVGSWPTSTDILGALARIDGGGHFHAKAHPRRYRTPLLSAFVRAAEWNGHSWREGEDELERRHGIVWRLRDMGLWPMPRC